MSEWYAESAHYGFWYAIYEGSSNRRVPLVYIITAGDSVAYVGQTSAGLRRRLDQHISGNTSLAPVFDEHERMFLLITVKRIAGCLDSAERYHIAQLQPTRNKVQYISGMVLPPTKQEPETKCVPWFHDLSPDYHTRKIEQRREQQIEQKQREVFRELLTIAENERYCPVCRTRYTPHIVLHGIYAQPCGHKVW